MPIKSIFSAALKGAECRPKAKTTSMSVKTKTMLIKSKALIDKSTALFCVFQTFCVLLESTGSENLITFSIHDG